MKKDGIMMNEGMTVQDHAFNREDSEIYIPYNILLNIASLTGEVHIIMKDQESL